MIPDIVYEDNHILVVNKIAGLPTQSDHTGQISLEQVIKDWIKERDQKKGNVFLHAIHRIDKPVSGLVLFAKTSKALARLNTHIQEKNTEKIYLAYVEGNDLPNTGELEHFLIHNEFRADIVPKTDPKGKRAHLSFSTLEKKNNKTLISIRLTTGRYHQIRAQFAATGHPIVGDRKYGSKIPYLENAIALHHFTFSIPHPISKNWITFEAPPSFDQERLHLQ